MFFVMEMTVEADSVIATLDREKEGCCQIVVSAEREPMTEVYLRHCFTSGLAFDFEIGARLSPTQCSARQLRLGAVQEDPVTLEASRTAGEFQIIAVRITRQETVFQLDKAKEGCNQIAFKFGQNKDISTVLMSLFEGGKLFDFNIVLNNAPKCQIDTVFRRF